MHHDNAAVTASSVTSPPTDGLDSPEKGGSEVVDAHLKAVAEGSAGTAGSGDQHGWREDELREQHAVLQQLIERAKSGAWLPPPPAPPSAADAWQSAASAADALESWAPDKDALVELEQKHTTVQQQLHQLKQPHEATTGGSGGGGDGGSHSHQEPSSAQLALVGELVRGGADARPGDLDADLGGVVQAARAEIASLSSQLRASKQELSRARARIAGAPSSFPAAARSHLAAVP
jgi:hypothetical protein